MALVVMVVVSMELVEELDQDVESLTVVVLLVVVVVVVELFVVVDVLVVVVKEQKATTRSRPNLPEAVVVRKQVHLDLCTVVLLGCCWLASSVLASC